MYFYKYQKPGNLEFNMLRHGEIYFAAAEELNDASECRPRFILNGTGDLWIRLARFILEQVCFNSGYFDQAHPQEIQKLLNLSTTVGTGIKKQVGTKDVGIEHLSNLFADILKPLLEKIYSAPESRLILQLSCDFIHKELPNIIVEPQYITSFSINATNPTMWGHYAKAERGFVIIYKTEDGTINVHAPTRTLYGSRLFEKFDDITEIGCYDEAHLKLKSVKYCKKPPKVNAFHRLIPKFTYTGMESHFDVPLLLQGDARKKEEHLIGLVKSSDWQYEQEIRAFFPNFGELNCPDVRVLRVSTNNIRGLIFGPGMADTDKKRAVLCCHLMRKSLTHSDEPAPEFAFFQAKQIVDRFDFEIQPEGILEDDYFGGERLPLKSLRHLDEATIKRLGIMSEKIKSKKSEDIDLVSS
ncbi:MAG: DUF2971 domain-containing protein [Parachlamydiaceae bacterium]